MLYFEQFIISYISSVCFGFIFNAPRRSLLVLGFIGASGWMITYTTMQFGMSIAPATFFGALFINVLCIFFSRKIRIPQIILSIPGIVPLVPGGPAYRTVRYMVEGHYTDGIEEFITLIYIAGAIVIGFMASNLIEQQFTNYMTRNRLTRRGFRRMK